MSKRNPSIVFVALGVLLTSGSVAAQTSPVVVAASDDALRQAFESPPASARPRVWWHWLNGNITKEGIRLDLEWMQRVGIGGFQTFDAGLFTPQVVARPLPYLSPEWDEALRYAADLADDKGLEMAIATSPGWSETGGPWVKPAQAMKKLVWSESEARGGQRLAALPTPPAVAGPYQDMPLSPSNFGGSGPPAPTYYRDVAVLAYPLHETPAPLASARYMVDGKSVDAAVLTDGSLARGVPVAVGTSDAASCVGIEYARPTRIAAATLALPVAGDFFHSALASPRLESSVDGVSWSVVTVFPAGGLIQHTVSFPPVNARHFRVCLAAPPAPVNDLVDNVAPGIASPPGFPALQASAGKPKPIDLRELQLHGVARVHRAEEKAGYAFVPDYYAIPTGEVDADDVIAKARILDLTSRLAPDGSLRWTPPAGRWKVLRFGYSLTGTMNHPAADDATGLEVDKFDGAHVKSYLDTYLGNYERALGPERIGAKGVRALLVDSTEVGAANWTDTLPAEFQRRRGYALLPWMPALTGTIIGSAADTDRFLYDFRQTLADLMSDAHYAQIVAAARSRGMTQYGEALEQGRPVLGDDMELRRRADVPMAAMWTYSPARDMPQPVRFADIRGAASVAHIYGQNLVAAESLTSALAPWNYAPRDLKPMIDAEFVLGVNRPVIHTSVHQPVPDKAPGLTLAIFGQMFNRNETWAEQSVAWVSYLSRTSYLLQQGRFAADVLYFYGEEAPLTALYAEQLTPDAPTRAGFDFANADVVLNRITVAEDGQLVTDSGMRYRFLYLGGTSSRMTLRVLERLAALVRDGATLVGNRPQASPSLSDDPVAFRALADVVWGDAPGKGRVLAGIDSDTALQRLGVAPDFDYRRSQPDSLLMFLHRRLEDGDLYFVTNRKARPERTEASFRVTGRVPELWHADTGRSEPVTYRIENGRTFVALDLAAQGACFVVFRQPAQSSAATVPARMSATLVSLDSGWKLAFTPVRGAASIPIAAEVGSWTQHADSAVRHFSGTGSYTRTLKVPASWKRNGAVLQLDLGDVRELAEVRVNGRSLGVLWHPPYRLDVTDDLRAGDNQLEVRVTNLWVNRLIGDVQPGATPVTFTTSPPYRADAPLRTSGLLGPVTLRSLRTLDAAGR